MTGGVVLRPGRDDDAEGFIRLIGDCWGEYPGCVMDVDGEVPELRALASYFANAGGALWVAEHAGRVAGMVGAKPVNDGAWEVCKVYLDRGLRGGTLAHDLVAAAEAHAIRAGAVQLFLWTDTRFTRAHGFYAKRSYIRQGPIRALHDLSNTLEYRYAKPGRGIMVERLDAAAAATAERPLSEILVACVEDGASVSFLPPLAPARARAFWAKVASDVALGQRALLAAWHDGVMVGTVQLDIGMPENQPHRAEVAKLLVHPRARRAGIARALMQRVEEEALAAGRSLLTLDTRAGDAAEPLYRSLGYTEAGRIPGYALNADRTPCDTLFFWKALA